MSPAKKKAARALPTIPTAAEWRAESARIVFPEPKTDEEALVIARVLDAEAIIETLYVTHRSGKRKGAGLKDSTKAIHEFCDRHPEFALKHGGIEPLWRLAKGKGADPLLRDTVKVMKKGTFRYHVNNWRQLQRRAKAKS